MRAAEILEAVENEFPGLTEKTLRQWVKAGLLQNPQKVGRGLDGVITEWASDSVERIKLIKTIAGERVSMEKARMVLIANGYFLGVNTIRSTLAKMLDELANNKANVKTKIKNNRIDAINTTQCLSNTLALAIADMMFNVQDARTGRLTPALRLIQLASIESIMQVYESLEDDDFEEYYYKSSGIFNLFHPVMCCLFGYTNEIDNGSPMFLGVNMGFLTQSTTPPKLEKYQFEFIMRMFLLVGFAIMKAYYPQIEKEIRMLWHQNTHPDDVQALPGKIFKNDKEREQHERSRHDVHEFRLLI